MHITIIFKPFAISSLYQAHVDVFIKELNDVFTFTNTSKPNMDDLLNIVTYTTQRLAPLIDSISPDWRSQATIKAEDNQIQLTLPTYVSKYIQRIL